MKLHAKQNKHKFLISLDDDPKAAPGAGLVADTHAGTVQRVKDMQKLRKQSRWEPITGSDPTLDKLVQSIPALRRYRGIEIRLSSGETAWIRWRQWSSESAAAQKLLADTTQAITLPTYEPDGDYFLAAQAITLLGGEILDAPRSVLILEDEAY